MEASMSLLWLGDESCHDPALVGGKAAHLSRLAARFAVPPGFVLPATMMATAWSADHARLPGRLVDQVAAAHARLIEITGIAEPRVAVRSSAVDEDGAAASFAGQHETYLNVTGVAGIVAAIERCLASVRSPRALAYRRQQGLVSDGAPLAVLVQLMAPADVSAVLFSANPISGRRDELVITASWGLGESIVGGTVTPDTYIVRKEGPTVAARQIAEKRRMTVATPDGTREVDVPRLLRVQPTLTEEQIIEGARLGLALEAAMGWPVDVEVAWVGGRLALLQCRPITTLIDAAAA
jgi:phosphoenolpyruvate synthase/pyruvate phosphate dikinase